MTSADVRAAHSRRETGGLFIFHEQYKHEVAFDVHRKAPYLTAYCERREKESLTEGSAELEIYRSLTD